MSNLEEIRNLYDSGLTVITATLVESKVTKKDGTDVIRKKLTNRPSDKKFPKYQSLPDFWRKEHNTTVIYTGTRDSPTNVFVIDIDIKENIEESLLCGLTKWNQLLQEYQDINTWIARTGNGGYHYYFAMEEKLKQFTIGCNLKVDNQKYSIDWRGDGGIIYAPPTQYQTYDKTSIKKYEWIKSPSDTQLSEIPDWIFNLLLQNTNQSNDKSNDKSKNKKYISGFGQKLPPIYTSQEIKYGEVKKLVEMLDKSRADNYDQWIQIGLCLHHLSPDFFHLWNNFSQNSSKYVSEIDCLSFWEKMTPIPRNGNDPLSLGSLKAWAKSDNPDQYYSHLLLEYIDFINKMEITDFQLMKLAHIVLKNVIVFDEFTKSFWTTNNNGKWKEDILNKKFKHLISSEIRKLALEAISYYSNKEKKEKEENTQSIWLKRLDKMRKILKIIETNSTKEKIIRESMELFTMEKFYHKLDKKSHLFAFDNGVYDLHTMTFRSTMPDDLITLSTNYDYTSTRDPDTEKEIMNYWKQVIRDDDVREFYLMILASCLESYNNEEIFVILSGVGCNSKGKSCELMETTFGDYAGIVEPDVFQSFTVDHKAADPALFNAVKCRFISTTEPKTGKNKFNCATIKRLTGRDKISVRQLYKSNITVVPHFTPFVQLNECPDIEDTSYGIVRRVTNIEFSSKFVQNPKYENEFLIDTELPKKFPSWRMSFFHILTDYYKKYIDIKNKYGTLKKVMPECIKVASKELLSEDNSLTEWFYKYVKEEAGSYLTLVDVTRKYQEWFYSSEYQGDEDKPFKKGEIRKTISGLTNSKCGGRKTVQGKEINNFWWNYKLNNDTKEI